MDRTTVAPANAEQLQAWDGEQGAYWAEHARRFDASMARYHLPFLDAAAIADGDRVLDIGCGNGQTTRDAARRTPSGSVLGVDLSTPMIAIARELAAQEALENVTFLQADAQVHPFPGGAADVAISRAGSMFFGDPVAAFANIGRALRPGGRLVLLVWQGPAHNEWLAALPAALAAGRPVHTPPLDAPGPFALSDPARVRGLLTSAGFADVAMRERQEPLWFGADPDDAYTFVLGMLGWMIRDLDDATRARALDAVRASIADHHTDAGGVQYGSGAWIIDARRP